MPSLMGAKYDRKAIPGITGLSRLRAQIDGAACYADVGSSHPSCAEAAKGGGVHPLKRLVSWVQNVNLALRKSNLTKNKIGSYR